MRIQLSGLGARRKAGARSLPTNRRAGAAGAQNCKPQKEACARNTHTHRFGRSMSCWWTLPCTAGQPDRCTRSGRSHGSRLGRSWWWRRCRSWARSSRCWTTLQHHWQSAQSAAGAGMCCCTNGGWDTVIELVRSMARTDSVASPGAHDGLAGGLHPTDHGAGTARAGWRATGVGIGARAAPGARGQLQSGWGRGAGASAKGIRKRQPGTALC